MSFRNFKFNSEISKVLVDHGYHTPTPIQKQAIQPLLEGKDILGLAQTGTGKTAAFSLPILQKLSSKAPGKQVKALILSPTRELANQTGNFIGEFTRQLNLSSCVVFGGASRSKQVNQLRAGANIVVACPGRLLDLVGSGDIDLSGVDHFVLDEADQMLDKGFLPDIKRITAKLPRRRQNLVFSATMPDEIKVLIEKLLIDPVRVSINHKKPNRNIDHTYYKVEAKGKKQLLCSILKDDGTGQAIVFTRTKYKARSLAHQLTKQGFEAISLQGNMSQSKREQALDGFRDGVYSVLVATDIAARGIDVVGISHVINYDMPDTTEAYTHRSGRTGRASRSGQAVTFATSEDKRMVAQLKTTLEQKLSLSNGNAGEDQASNGGDRAVNRKNNMARPTPGPNKKAGKKKFTRNRQAAV